MLVFVLVLRIRRPPRSTRTDTLFPYTTLFRAELEGGAGHLEGDHTIGAHLRVVTHPAQQPVGDPWGATRPGGDLRGAGGGGLHRQQASRRSDEHTSELQSLMRISYAVFCLEKQNESIISEIHQSEVHSLI